jgi:hypothetical protein
MYSTGQCVPNVFGHRTILGLKYADGIQEGFEKEY